MKLNWLQSVLYGFVSGITELLPVSSQGHKSLLLYMFGSDGRDPLCDMFIRLAVLVCICVCFKKQIMRLVSAFAQRGRRTSSNRQIYYERKLFSTAAIPLIAGILLYSMIVKQQPGLAWVAAAFLVNGFILFLTEHLRFGDKNARLMSGFDSFLMGAAGALSAVPGLSGIGGVMSAGVARGADRRQCAAWAILLLIPVLVSLAGVDLIAVFAGANTYFGFWKSLLAGLSAFCGAYCGIKLLLYFVAQIGFSGFAYYSWGASLFTLILFLIT